MRCVILHKIVDFIKRANESDDPISNVNRLRKMGAKVGDNVHIYSSMIDPTYAPYISIGNNVTITNAVLLCHDASTNKFFGATKLKRIAIGDNVFVGYHSIILPGVSVGNNCIIGAGSVVRSNIEDNSVVIGNPAQVICSTSDYIAKSKDYYDKLGKKDLIDIGNEDDYIFI